MASYQIVCVNTQHAHRHITDVGVLTNGNITRMTTRRPSDPSPTKRSTTTSTG